MNESKPSTVGWVVMFFLALIVAIGFAIGYFYQHSQNSKLSSRLSSVEYKYSQLTSSNAQNQQACVTQAQNEYEGENSLLPNSSSDLSSAVSACEAEYPTN